MTYIWDLTPEKWQEYKKNAESMSRDSAQCYLCCARIGEICFDVYSYWNAEEDSHGLKYVVFQGGVEGYGYSKREPVESGKYKFVEEVPAIDAYPYVRLGEGMFESDCSTMSMDLFRKKAENEFTHFLLSADNSVMEAATKELHVF